MKAMVLAAGIGKRLLPFTKDMPKPLIEVGSETLLDRNIKKLLELGISEIMVNVSYLGDMIESTAYDQLYAEHMYSVYPLPFRITGALSRTRFRNTSGSTHVRV